MTLVSKDNLDQVQLWMTQQRFQRYTRLRVFLLPVLTVVMLLTLVGDHARWRWIIIGTAAVIAALRSLTELARVELPLPRPPDGLSAVAAVPVGLFIMATGGLDSPITPVLMVMSFFVGVLAPARALASLTIGLTLVVGALLYVSAMGVIPDLMPAVFGGGPGLRQPAALLYAKAGMMVLGLVWVGVVSNAVREIFRQMVHDAVDARDEVLESHDAHARELTALSGELAHELKNPLANVKGLAVLAAREAQGRVVERLEVLQAEVGRMEEILQGFLAFSRPLSPVSQEAVELKGLCESIVSLHEGMAYTRGVPLAAVAPAEVQVTCDPRKVKQILINLVQNALDASPVGAEVELAVLPAGDGGARVEVRDRGPGIAPEVRAHLFELGATTKTQGTGLGLALARGLARQHGGELTLEDREGGGSTAVLVLPAKGT